MAKVVVARAMAVRVGLRMARAWMVRVVVAVEMRVRAARAAAEVMVTRRGRRGIGFFFYTRKGSFLYKISLYIITYHVSIIVYHCVSLSISQYIMSLGDT